MNRKNHFFKRVFAVLMVVILTVSPVPLSCFVGLELPNWLEMFATRASAASEGYYTYTVSNGEATITNYNSSISGAVVIPDTLGGYPVTSIGNDAFDFCTGLTSITIPDSVTSIGNSAFSGCYDLKSITIPDSVTNIGSSAFYNCFDLRSITIPDSVKSIGSSAFWGCSGLTSITIPDSVTSIGEFAFQGCTGLTKIFWNAESVSDFYSLATPFYNAGTAGAGMDIIFGDSVKSIPAYAFYVSDSSYNPKIKSVTIGNSVTSIGKYAFYDCSGLTSITIPDSVTSIGEYAFQGCTGLTSITIPDSVTSIGSSAFAGTAWYEAQPFGDVYAGKIYYKYKGTMLSNTSIVIKDGTKGIAGSAFYDCNGLTSITIPDSVTNIGSSAFQDCDGLKSITIPDSVTSIGKDAFKGCTGLTNIIIPDSVTIVGEYAFYYCSDLKSVTIGNGVETVSKATFDKCPLTTIKIGRNVKTIEVNAFNGIKSIPEVYYAGSESDWKSISIDQTNDMILRATMHYNVDITHTHSYTSKITKAATCIENGTKTFTCDCGKTYTETIPATGHKTSSWITDKAATCLNDGSKHRECTVCKTKLETATISAAGHKSSSWITDKAATCVNDGSKHRECTVCKTKLETATISAAGHNFKTETVAATCTSVGYVTKICQTCRETQFIKSIPATGHTPGEWIVDKEATCTNDGSKHKECSVCKEKLETAIIPTTAHNFKTETTDATCTSIGYVTKICQNCGECQFVKGIPAKGHSVKTVSVPATFTESGLSITSCKTCGTITKATLIKRVASVALSKTAFTYNGKVQTPTVIVKDSSGKVLKRNTDYTVSHAAGRKNPGQYSVKVTFKGDYSGTKTLTFTIAPGTPTLTATAGAKKATLKWNKQTGATGYVVYMATTKSGKFAKAATLKGNSKVSYTKTGLTKGKTYYFKVCAYTTVGGKTVYGAASAVKAVKVK